MTRRRRTTSTTRKAKGSLMSETANGPQLPAWFDEEKHIAEGAHIMERATGLYLDGDGLPHSGPIRARRLAEAGETTDPREQVSDDAIATARLHLDQEREAAEAAAAAKTEGE